jgi:hypothetical protein
VIFIKKLTFLLIFILLSQLAEAKTILYVANTSTDTPCSSLQTTDSLYCNRLTNLGYNIKVINELHVKDNSTTWNEYADSSDMIFLGSNSLNVADKTKFQNIFCGNASSKNKPLFLTSVNTWISKNIEGCAFHPSINLVTFNFSDNKCSTKAFKIAKAGFITEGFGIDENITIYPTPKTAKIYDISNEGWITAECVPPNASIDFYPVLYTNNKGVFWGLDEPSSFSNTTWDIFDRTVLYMLNDTAWSITAFALPSIASINQDVLIFANVTGKAVKGTVNFTVDGLTGNMNYDGLWKSIIKLTETRQYNLNITAYSKSLRGSFNLPISVGSLVVDITSGNFKPNLNYVVSAKISGATSASYRILNPSNYNAILSGALTCENNVCNGNVESMPDMSSLLLEVTVYGDGNVGGNFKTITKETLSTDKNVYKPGETIKIDFFTFEPLTQVNLTIIRPGGTKETPSPLQMDKISTNYWNKNYSLGLNSYNGTYVINVKTIKGEYNKSIDVVAWKPFAYLNKKIFNVFESLVLTVGTTEAYSGNLDIYASAEIMRSDGNITSLGNFTVKGNSIYNFSYVIPRGYPSGLSTIKISFKDSSNRSSVLYLNFSTNITLLQPSLFVTPSTISITTVSRKTIKRTVTLENTAQIKATNIIKSVSGFDMTVAGPSSLESGGSAEVKITISTGSLSEGTYPGKVNFFSQVGDTELTVSLDILGDLSSQASEKYSEVVSLENNLTYLSKMWVNTTNASKLLNETKAVLNETIIEYRRENYATAKAKFEEASTKFTELETEVSNLYGKLPDYSFIVWDFAIAVVVIIIVITIIKIKGRRKKQKVKRKEVPKEPKKEEVYFEPKGGEYRTEYY